MNIELTEALVSLWREAAQEGIADGVDYPGIVVAITDHLAAVQAERDEARANRDRLAHENADLRRQVAELTAEKQRLSERAANDLLAAERALAAGLTLAEQWRGRHDLVMTGDSAAHDLSAALGGLASQPDEEPAHLRAGGACEWHGDAKPCLTCIHPAHHRRRGGERCLRPQPAAPSPASTWRAPAPAPTSSAPTTCTRLAACSGSTRTRIAGAALTPACTSVARATGGRPATTARPRTPSLVCASAAGSFPPTCLSRARLARSLTMAEHDPALVEKAAEAIYPLVMETWEDRWPLWEYADDGQADFMREVARAVLDVLAPLVEQARQEGAREALRAAADEIGEGDGISRFIGMDDLPAAIRAEKRAQQWLRDRAERAATPGSGTAGGGS